MGQGGLQTNLMSKMQVWEFAYTVGGSSGSPRGAPTGAPGHALGAKWEAVLGYILSPFPARLTSALSLRTPARHTRPVFECDVEKKERSYVQAYAGLPQSQLRPEGIVML